MIERDTQSLVREGRERGDHPLAPRLFNSRPRYRGLQQNTSRRLNMTLILRLMETEIENSHSGFPESLKKQGIVECSCRQFPSRTSRWVRERPATRAETYDE